MSRLAFCCATIEVCGTGHRVKEHKIYEKESERTNTRNEDKMIMATCLYVLVFVFIVRKQTPDICQADPE